MCLGIFCVRTIDPCLAWVRRPVLDSSEVVKMEFFHTHISPRAIELRYRDAAIGLAERRTASEAIRAGLRAPSWVSAVPSLSTAGRPRFILL